MQITQWVSCRPRDGKMVLAWVQKAYALLERLSAAQLQYEEDSVPVLSILFSVGCPDIRAQAKLFTGPRPTPCPLLRK